MEWNASTSILGSQMGMDDHLCSLEGTQGHALSPVAALSA